MKKSNLAVFPLLMLSWGANAESSEEAVIPANSSSTSKPVMEEVLVTGGRDNIKTLGGSAQLVDETTLEEFNYTDLNQVMGSLPGVYIRQEDGYGLRPNIGIRGATSERSQKITLMEDGVLIAPAPYTAPAAYYIPNVSRMQAVEVLKGPAAIKHGPHTVGGAVNLATPAIPDELTREVELTVGSDAFNKLRFFYGDNTETFGYWVEGLTFGGDGFKELDTGGNTGFRRNDVNAKLQWRSEEGASRSQQFTLKLGYADEDSDETYLGLTDEDFAENPHRRYAASQLDKFESDHSQVHLDHVIVLDDSLKLNSKVYWNRFNRSWNKFDGFIGLDETQEGFLRDVAADNVLDISQYSVLRSILRGDLDSNGSDDQTIDVTNNDRTYGSYGAQLVATKEVYGERFDQEIMVGLRYHHDYVDRHHKVKGYLMQDSILVDDKVSHDPKVRNHGETDALALFVEDKITFGDWEVTTGLRYENIEGELENLEEGTTSSNSQDVLMPGVGAFWQMNDNLGWLVGVNKGFSPAGPGSGDDVEPEESINYEYGLRYQYDLLYVEMIGFFSDYDNLLGRCRVSDSGCTGTEEFNGGNVEISGWEVIGQYEWSLDGGFSIPLSLSYTYSESAFQTSFTSDFSQWGVVDKGDELPYLPEHQGRIQIGLNADLWQVLLAYKHQDAMREIPGQASIYEAQHTDTLNTFDLSLTWYATESLTTQLTVDNLTDEEAIVSHRPFGARPNKPRTFNAGIKYDF